MEYPYNKFCWYMDTKERNFTSFPTLSCDPSEILQCSLGLWILNVKGHLHVHRSSFVQRKYPLSQKRIPWKEWQSEASEEMKETDLAVPLFGCEMFSGWNLPARRTPTRKGRWEMHFKVFTKWWKEKPKRSVAINTYKCMKSMNFVRIKDHEIEHTSVGLYMITHEGWISET